MFAAHFGEGLVGALHDALRANIDPRAGRHLAVHHEPLLIELVEIVPCPPMRHEVGIGDQHARRILVGPEDAHGFARLDQQRLVILQRLEAGDDAVEGFPVACGAADAAIDHEFLGPFGDTGVEVVHQHAHWRLGEPALGADLRAGGRLDDARVVAAGIHEKTPIARACRVRWCGSGCKGHSGWPDRSAWRQ